MQARRSRAQRRDSGELQPAAAGLLSGAAAAGVLDGKRATTHWKYVTRLAARYPLIRVEMNALYVDEGRVLTSAGSAAGLDMLLHLVRRDHGAKIAKQVAQRLVMAPHRDGGQAPHRAGQGATGNHAP